MLTSQGRVMGAPRRGLGPKAQHQKSCEGWPERQSQGKLHQACAALREGLRCLRHSVFIPSSKMCNACSHKGKKMQTVIV